MTHVDTVWAKALEMHSDSLQYKVDSLQAKIDALQVKSDLMYNVVESANSGVANQISTMTLWLEFIAILIAIGGGLLGFYISNKRREVVKMARTVDEKAEKVDSIAKTTKDLDNKIHNDLTGLYKKLHQEETKTLLERLVLEPLDISNIIKLLLARDIDDNNFDLLRVAFLKFLETVRDDSNENTTDENDYVIGGSYYEPNFNYQILFFQHYCEQSIKDDAIRPYMMEQLIDIMDGAFKRDMLKSTKGLCMAISDEYSTFDKVNVLVGFLKALNNSKHKEYAELKELLENGVDSSLLERAKDKCKEQKEYLALFGLQSPKVDDSEKEINSFG